MTPPPATTTARRVLVRLSGDAAPREMWVKPWAAVVGAPVAYRELGSDWPWHHGILLARHDRVYVIEET